MAVQRARIRTRGQVKPAHILQPRRHVERAALARKVKALVEREIDLHRVELRVAELELGKLELALRRQFAIRRGRRQFRRVELQHRVVEADLRGRRCQLHHELIGPARCNVPVRLQRPCRRLADHPYLLEIQTRHRPGLALRLREVPHRFVEIPQNRALAREIEPHHHFVAADKRCAR